MPIAEILHCAGTPVKGELSDSGLHFRERDVILIPEQLRKMYARKGNLRVVI